MSAIRPPTAARVTEWPRVALKAPDIQPGSNHGYLLPRATDPWGASMSWITRGAATSAATPAKSSQARRHRIAARPMAMTAMAKRLWTWMIGRSPTRSPATPTSKSRARARSKTARRSTRDATTTSKPSMRVRWGSHQAKSGVYHAWSVKTGVSDSGSEVMPSKLVGWSATSPGRAWRVPAVMPMPAAGFVMT